MRGKIQCTLTDFSGAKFVNMPPGRHPQCNAISDIIVKTDCMHESKIILEYAGTQIFIAFPQSWHDHMHGYTEWHFPMCINIYISSFGVCHSFHMLMCHLRACNLHVQPARDKRYYKLRDFDTKFGSFVGHSYCVNEQHRLIDHGPLDADVASA